METQKIFTQETTEHEVENPSEKKERLFTQEEVNKIIQNRLNARKKEQARVEYNEEEFQKREQALAEREDAFNKQVELYNRTEFLRKHKYPEELLELVTVGEGESFEDKIETIVSLVDKTSRNRMSFDYIAEAEGTQGSILPSIGTKHEPRLSHIR